ncbi:hypothetical protein [Myxococcus xanthus]|uniref:hypothetical protein n=1 Tax=Myxococcus xanthus TaxID=34 RepID=UPI0013762CC3|nr:hypothetical protein [Myxococcus xanthus]
MSADQHAHDGAQQQLQPLAQRYAVIAARVSSNRRFLKTSIVQGALPIALIAVRLGG